MKNMESCTSFRTELSARHDGEGSANTTILEAHLADCAECTAFGEELAGLSSLFDAHRRIEPPATLIEAVTKETYRTRKLPVQRTAAVWAMRAAAGWIGFLAISQFAQPQNSTAADAPYSQSTVELFARLGRTLGPQATSEVIPERELLLRFAAYTENQR